jgi:hypothetical protein
LVELRRGWSEGFGASGFPVLLDGRTGKSSVLYNSFDPIARYLLSGTRCGLPLKPTFPFIEARGFPLLPGCAQKPWRMSGAIGAIGEN